MKVVTACYYTVGNEYEKHAQRLRTSADKFGVGMFFKDMPPFPSWKDAVCFKPTFIRKCLDSFPEIDGLLYVDADAEFVQDVDHSIFFFSHVSACLWKRLKGHAPEVLTGTLWFANTPTTHAFIEEWESLTPKFKSYDTPEQESLRITLKHWKDRVIFHDMPKEYVYIADDFEQRYPDLDPVIVHHQASRRLRKCKT